ncbi:MAG: LCP family protein [bacterium]
MKQVTIDLDGVDDSKGKKIDPKGKKLSPDKKKKVRKIVILSIIALLLCAGGYFLLRVLGIISGTGLNINPFQLLSKEEPELKKDEQGRTNMLFVGIDTSPSSPGLRNTDTIIVASFNHNTNEALLMSIPRDMWVQHPYNKTYHSKINAVYNSCENQDEGTGLGCLADVTEEVTNLDIHYSAMLDISGLIEVVDIVGGVEVNVENGFTDYMFPQGNGYTIVSFESGLQKMDGQAAMEYARSRHSQGPEGSDFARARRQQNLIKAIITKMMSMETYMNPAKILEIAEQVGDNVKFEDINLEDIKAGINIAKDFNFEDVYSVVLDPSIGDWSIITEDPSDAYILLPELGIDKWDDLHKFVTAYIDFPGMYDERPKIYIYNGGLGNDETLEEVDSLMDKYPYIDIVFAGNSSNQDYVGNNIISFSEETKYKSIVQLEKFFKTKYSADENTDFTPVYGEDLAVILGAPETADSISETKQ